MNLLTESINCYLEEFLEKDRNEFLIRDLLSISFLTIDGMDDYGTRQKIYFEDLLEFKNLRYLEIAHVLVDNTLIAILSQLNYLESIVFRNCRFSQKIIDMNMLKNIKCIRVLHCYNFDISYINRLDNLERLYISDRNINTLDNFNTLKLEALDISECNLKKISGIDDIKTNYLVVSSKQFQKFRESILDLKMRVMVMADPSVGYYIERWLN